MKLNFINEAKLNIGQLSTIDKIIRQLKNMKKGDYKGVAGGWGSYKSLNRYLSEIESSLYSTQELEVYDIPSTILKLIEKYPESVKVLQEKFKIIDPITGRTEEFYFSSMQDARRKMNETETKGKTQAENKIITMLRNRQGYRTLRNYVNYLKKMGFTGTKGLELQKLRLKMPHVTLLVRQIDAMQAMHGSVDTDRNTQWSTISTNGEYLKVEELISTINEVQLAAKTIGVDIDNVFVDSDGGVLYSIDGSQIATKHLKVVADAEIYVDSDDVESVQDAYKIIKQGIEKVLAHPLRGEDAEFAARAELLRRNPDLH